VASVLNNGRFSDSGGDLHQLEHTTLAALMRRKYWDTYSGLLSEKLFSGPITKAVYQAIVTMQGTSPGDIGFDTLAMAMDQYQPEKAKEWRHVLAVMEGADVDAAGVSGIVRKHVQTQRLLDVAEKIGRYATGGQIDLHGLAQEVDLVAALDIAESVVLDYSVHAGIHTEDVVYAGARPLGLTPEIDDFLKGGVVAGELLSFVGTPGAGKTALLINVGASAFRAGAKVLHVTTEIAGDRVANRYDLAMGGTDTLTSSVATALQSGGRLLIRDVGGADVSPFELESFIRRDAKGIDLLVVDYADELKSSRSYQEKRHELNRVYKELRQVAKRLVVPVVTATQATRGAMSKRIIGLEDIAESFDIARIADILISINPYEEQRSLVGLKVIKARRRSTRPMWDVEIDYDNCRVIRTATVPQVVDEST
jgi:replicative DNA helicase